MMPRTLKGSAPSKGLLGVLVAILFLAAAYFYQDPEWNGNSRLDLTRAIVEQGTFRIDAFQSQSDWATEDRALYQGHYYSDKAIGSSLLAAPFYLVLYRMGTLLGITLGSAFVKHVLTVVILGVAFTVTGVSMYLVAQHIMGKTWEPLIPTLAIAFGTMLWPYSAVFYGHVVAAALLIVAFYLVFARSEAPESISPARLCWIGLAMGSAFITEYTSALVIAGLLLYILYVLRNQGISKMVRAGIMGGAGALIPLSLMFAYNLAVYGNALSAGYSYEAENRFQEGMSLGIMGIHLPSATNTYHITLDPQFGLFWQSPVLLLAALGFLFALRSPRYRPEGLLCLGSVGAMIAMNGGYYLWWGGSAFGPRLLIPALPFFIVPLALLPHALTWATGCLGILSAAQMLIPLVGQIQPGNLVYRVRRNMFYIGDIPFRGFSLLYDYGLPQIFRRYSAGNPSWTLGAALGLPYVLSIPALIAAEAGLIFRFYRRTKADRVPSNQNPSKGASNQAAALDDSTEVADS